MLSYHAAVAARENGFKKIKIYNGGIKDWKKSGLPVARMDPLPEYNGGFLSAEELLAFIKKANKNGCLNKSMRPYLTLIDLRASAAEAAAKGKPTYWIKSHCRSLIIPFDDLLDEKVRAKIPMDTTVVTVTETGNRDNDAMRFLAKFGHGNIKGLQYGMRGWLKLGYPVE